MQDNYTQASFKESIYSKMNFIHLRYNWENLSKKTASEHLIYLNSDKSWMSWRFKILYDTGYVLWILFCQSRNEESSRKERGKN